MPCVLLICGSADNLEEYCFGDFANIPVEYCICSFTDILVEYHLCGFADIQVEYSLYDFATGTRSMIFNEIASKDNHLLNNVT